VGKEGLSQYVTSSTAGQKAAFYQDKRREGGFGGERDDMTFGESKPVTSAVIRPSIAARGRKED